MEGMFMSMSVFMLMLMFMLMFVLRPGFRPGGTAYLASMVGGIMPAFILVRGGMRTLMPLVRLAFTFERQGEKNNRRHHGIGDK